MVGLWCIVLTGQWSRILKHRWDADVFMNKPRCFYNESIMNRSAQHAPIVKHEPPHGLVMSWDFKPMIYHRFIMSCTLYVPKLPEKSSLNTPIEEVMLILISKSDINSYVIT